MRTSPGVACRSTRTQRRHYGRIVSARTRAGRPISVEDAQIAAIALAHRMPLATRNTTDFELIDGLEVVNPWTDGAVATRASGSGGFMTKTIEAILAPRPAARPRIYAYAIDDAAHAGLLKVGQVIRLEKVSYDAN
jgi:hypothetical protein